MNPVPPHTATFAIEYVIVLAPSRSTSRIARIGLSEGSGGDPKAQQCGWLKDRYGQSWQIVPTIIPELFQDHESAPAQRAMEAMLKMKKLDIAELERAGGKERAAHS